MSGSRRGRLSLANCRLSKSIRMADMALVARATAASNGRGIEIGSRTTSSQLTAAIASDPERGSYVATTAIDGIERHNAYMRVANYPMYVLLGIATQDVAPEWRNQTAFVLILGAVAIGITGMGAYLIARRRKQEFDSKFSAAQREADLVLLRTNQLLTMSEKAAGSGSWSWTVGETELNWSAQLYALFGLDSTAGRPTIDTWRKAVHPEDLAEAERRITESLQENKPFITSYRIILPDGQERWIDAYGMPSYDASGSRRSMHFSAWRLRA